MRKQTLVWAISGTSLLVCAMLTGNYPRDAFSDEPSAAEKPVEPDMHEFMEYVFEPSYKRLKAAMAAAPADNNGWKVIKAESLTLAESANLLLHRIPKDDGAAWSEQAIAVRDLGGQFYKAAKQKDFPAAREHYQGMLKNCNRCHEQFAMGKHILAP